MKYQFQLPSLALTSRFGIGGTILKRVVARAVRFLIVYQEAVNARLEGEIRQLLRRAEATERSLEQIGSLWSQVTAMDASLSQTRFAVARIASSLPQQISNLAAEVESSRSSMARLLQEHQLVLEQLQTMSAATTALQAEVHVIGEGVRDRSIYLRATQMLEIEGANLSQTAAGTSYSANNGSGLTDLFADDHVASGKQPLAIESRDDLGASKPGSIDATPFTKLVRMLFIGRRVRKSE